MNLREWALPLYTILMQLAIGSMFCLWIIRTLNTSKFGKDKIDVISVIPVLIIFSTIALAMIGAHFHLSRPYLSFLAIRNFGSSWLSREIVFTFIVFVCTGALLLALRYRKGSHGLINGLGWGVILTGFVTVYCMARIYLLPTQVAWNSAATVISYYAVMILLGSTALIVILLMDLRFSAEGASQHLEMRIHIIRQSTIWLTVIATVTAILVLGLMIYQIEMLRAMKLSSAQTSLQLILGLYKPLLIMRIVLTSLGVLWLVAVVTYFSHSRRSVLKLLEPIYIACILVLIGEILERFLFYATHVRVGI